MTRGAPSRAPPARNGASGSVAPATVLDHGAVDASGIGKGALAREGQYVLDLTPDEWTAIELSLRIAVVATVVALPFGIAIAWLLARKNFWGKALLDGLVHLPLVLPPVVTGYLLLISFGRKEIGRAHV